jgi:cbb3-type cytochrome oxidase cytochrome c subunit
MKNGPLIFLGGLIAMISCWCVLVVAPVVGLGALSANVDNTTGQTYPLDRPGAAKQGAEIYRSLGCAECHTRHATQSSLWFGARITELNTNKPDVVAALVKIGPGWTAKEASDLLGGDLPIQVLENVGEFAAKRAEELLKAAGCKAELTVHNNGVDLGRGWGLRQSVARDYLHDDHVLIGARRIGPDLANLGIRSPEAHVGAMNLFAPETNAVARLEERRQWHLRRLYRPDSTLEGARCPSYKFLFEESDAPVSGPHSALDLPEKFAPAAGRVVVPRPEAEQLVAWLLAQRADVSLPEAPVQNAEASTAAAPAADAKGKQ